MYLTMLLMNEIVMESLARAIRPAPLHIEQALTSFAPTRESHVADVIISVLVGGQWWARRVFPGDGERGAYPALIYDWRSAVAPEGGYDVTAQVRSVAALEAAEKRAQ